MTILDGVVIFSRHVITLSSHVILIISYVIGVHTNFGSLSLLLEPDAPLLNRWQLYASVFQEQAAVLRPSHSHSKSEVAIALRMM